MFVYYADSGPVHRSPMLMNAACDVDVFGVHEKAFVKYPALPQGVIAKKQKTP